MIKEEKMIQMVSVDSLVIREIGYNYKTNELIVIINKDSFYLYNDVPESVYNSFINFKSKGSFFSHNIKGKYTSKKYSYCEILSNNFYYNCDTNEIIDNRENDIIPSKNKQERVTEKLINKIDLLIKENKLTDDKLNQLLEILGE